MHGRVAVALGVVSALLPTAGAPAGLRFAPYGPHAGCATLRVPLDHSHETPGTVKLAVRRVAARGGATRPPLFALAGGPGESAIDNQAEWTAAFGAADPHRDFHGTAAGLRLEAYEYVPGLPVTGSVPRRGFADLTIGGPGGGHVEFAANGTVNGQVGGEAVSGHLALPRLTPSRAPAR